MKERIIKAEFFGRSTETIAKKLIGKKLIRKIGREEMSCRIVEAEAYLPTNDDACHASKKKTPKNEVMFGPPGLIYVYSIHARYCVNFVTEKEGKGCAVLIRAAIPLDGIKYMRQRRRVERDRELLNGPAKLCEAKSIDKELNGKALSRSSGLWLVDDDFQVESESIVVTPRIGVTSAKDKLLRFVLKGSEFASGPKYLR